MLSCVSPPLWMECSLARWSIAGSIHPCCCVVRGRCSPLSWCLLLGALCGGGPPAVACVACVAWRACMEPVACVGHACACRAMPCVHARVAGVHACMRARGVCGSPQGPLWHASHPRGAIAGSRLCPCPRLFTVSNPAMVPKSSRRRHLIRRLQAHDLRVAAAILLVRSARSGSLRASRRRVFFGGSAGVVVLWVPCVLKGGQRTSQSG